MNSEDLDELVKQYTKEKKQKQRAMEEKAECQHCGKQMSAKSLKYSHKRNCKKDPSNAPAPPPPPPAPEPTAKIRSRKTVVKKQKAEPEPEYVIQSAPPEDIKQPFTTSYVRLMELQRSARTQQKQQRMKTLASQAF